MAKANPVGVTLFVVATIAVMGCAGPSDDLATPTPPPSLRDTDKAGQGLEQRVATLEAMVRPTPTAVPTPTPTRAQNVALIAEPGESGINYGDEGLLRDLCVAIDWEQGLTNEEWGTVLELYVVKTSGTKGEPLKRATWTLTGSGSSQICQPPFG